MKLYVKEKLMSFHNRYFIYDESGEVAYEIESKVISIGDKTTIYDMSGNKVAYIEQEIFNLTPNYNIYIKDSYAFKISKKFQLFKNDYVLSNGYEVEGNFLMFDFVIYDEKNKKVGSIKRQLISFGDKYEINILDPSKKEIVLAIIVAITNDINRMQNSSNN